MKVTRIPALLRHGLLHLFVYFGATLGQLAAQTDHAPALRAIHDVALADGRCHAWLNHLTKRVGHRLSGSAGAERAVQWTKSVLDTLGLDSVWLQPVMVPHWERGAPEQVTIEGRKGGKIALSALALGGSIGTGRKGVMADIVEVKSRGQLEALGEAGVRGKIVFFNRPMDPRKLRTFEAYGGAVDQRAFGASWAAQYGAVAVLVRSMNLRNDDFPHTGSLVYDTAYARIPAAALSTNAANQLSEILRAEGRATVRMRLDCRTLPDAPSFNVVGEIRGTERPKEIILVGGHLDSWDVGEGAHDDGTGCVQSMDALRYLKKTGYKPRRTLRVVLFMNEENGTRGGRQYAAEALRKGEFHHCAIESDAGGFAPRGFTFDADESVFDHYFAKIKTLEPLFASYNMTLTKGGSGVDIGPLKPQKGLLCGYLPDSQRYFEYHHTAADVFEAVNQRELELGAAAMSSLMYLLDHL